MKIIFDSEEQKTLLMDARCPTDVNAMLDDSKYEDVCKHMENCRDCWKNSGIELEVK